MQYRLPPLGYLLKKLANMALPITTTQPILSCWHRYVATSQIVGNQLINRLISTALVDLKRLLARHSDANQHRLQPLPPAFIGHRRSHRAVVVAAALSLNRPFIDYDPAHFLDK